MNSNKILPEVKIVTDTHVCCDGGEGPLGHPRVWLQIARDKKLVKCGYCDKLFKLEIKINSWHKN